ncbi:MAG: hypothetical protein ABSG22_05155 [Sedimentisphaerales bacterium]
MLLYSRRFTIWLVSFLAVLVVYFIYNRLSRTPPIPTDASMTPAGQLADVCNSNGKVGMVGDVGVGIVKNARYTTLNAQKQVEREFGFRELLHQDGNDWEIEKPYMNIYRRSFRCEITGERAKVAVELAGGRVTPKQGMLMGNVTIRIWPQRKEGPGETTIYLDDIAFSADKSLFSTAGPIELVSENIKMTGTGMEIVYNGDDERLERLQITNLQSLRIKRWSEGTVLRSTPDTDANNQKQKSENPPLARPHPSLRDEVGERASKQGKYYQCTLDKNVRIETLNEQLLADALLINDIFMPGGSAEQAGKETLPDNNTAPIPSSNKPRAAVSTESPSDVSITCDGGIIVTPMSAQAEKESPKQQTTYAEIIAQQDTNTCPVGKTTFRGGNVTYSAATGEAVAIGLSSIAFDVNEKTSDGTGSPATVRITSRRQAAFSPASNKGTFEGDCRCAVSQEQGEILQQYIVLADKLEIDMAKKNTNKDSGLSMNVNRLIASGPNTHLASTKKTVRPGSPQAGSTNSPQAGDKLLGGIELKCASIDYNTADGNFFAAGPGLIKVDNSQTDEPQEKLGRFSLRRKCYALLRNFDSLVFAGERKHLIADSKGGSLLVDYFPLVEGRSNEKVSVTASHVEADIAETLTGRMELRDLLAKGAVTYEDKDAQVVGSEFIYDANTALIDIRGDKYRPCNFNGAIIDAVRYDTKTGKWNTRIKGPGAIR